MLLFSRDLLRGISRADRGSSPEPVPGASAGGRVYPGPVLASGAMRLRVLTLNVWGLPPPVGRVVSQRLDRILGELPALGCDVALFQEVWTEEAREQLRAGGAAVGLPHCWWPPGPAHASGGLLALSRPPIREPSFRRYTLCGLPQRITQMDYYAGKGLGRFEIELDAGPVSLFDTHLHARYAPQDVEDDYIGHRAAEVIELAAELRATRTPVVLAGDLNMRDVAPEYELLLGMTGLVDAAAALDHRQLTSTLQNAFRLARGAVSESRIDYLMSRSGLDRGVRPLSVRRVFDRNFELDGSPATFSDHAGVLADFEVGGPGAPVPPIAPGSFALARELLANGRRRARRRRLEERVGAGAGLAAAVTGAAALRRPALSRRRFLRLGVGSAAGLMTPSAGGLLFLSENVVPEELRDYDEVETLLDRLQIGESLVSLR